MRSMAARRGRFPPVPPHSDEVIVAKGQIKQAKHNKPKLTVKEKFARKQAKLLAKGK